MTGATLRLDDNDVNFILGTDSGEYYVDTMKPYSFRTEDGDKVLTYMTEQGYNQEDVRIVERSIEQLKELRVK